MKEGAKQKQDIMSNVDGSREDDMSDCQSKKS